MTGSHPAFSDAEYRRRHEAVIGSMPELGLDALVVTYSLHVEYLTGTWGSQFWVSPVILVPGRPPGFLVREFEADRVTIESRVPVLGTYFDREDAVAAWASALRDLGLADARLGLELDNDGLTYRDVTELQRHLPGLTIVDASHVLPRLMAVKSSEELEAMRAAMTLTERAIQVFKTSLIPGVTETAVRSRMREEVLAAGSEDLRGEVVFGRHSAVPHGRNTATVLRTDDLAVTEVSGYVNGYCAALCRTAVVGRQREARAVYDVAREAVDAALSAMRPGALAGDVDRAARDAVESAGHGQTFRHRTGYSNGLRANGRRNISLSPGATDVLEDGMTFHTPVILFVRGRFSVACSETAVVSHAGGQSLSRLGRDLIEI